MEPHVETEITEISIDTQEGLEAFAEHIDSIRTDLEELQAQYHEQYNTVAEVFYQAGESYRLVRSIILVAIEEVATRGQVSPAIVESLQKEYDTLHECRDVLYTAVTDATTMTENETPVSEPVLETPIASPFFAVAKPAEQTSPVTGGEKQRYAARATKRSENMFTKKAPDNIQLDLLTPDILRHARYEIVIGKRFHSPQACERALLQIIARREQVSRLDQVLGVAYKSPFHTFLKDLDAQEIAELAIESRAEMLDRTAALQVEYRVYHEWMLDVAVIQELVRPHAAMKFGEMYARAELELWWQELQAE